MENNNALAFLNVLDENTYSDLQYSKKILAPGTTKFNKIRKNINEYTKEDKNFKPLSFEYQSVFPLEIWSLILEFMVDSVEDVNINLLFVCKSFYFHLSRILVQICNRYNDIYILLINAYLANDIELMEHILKNKENCFFWDNTTKNLPKKILIKINTKYLNDLRYKNNISLSYFNDIFKINTMDSFILLCYCEYNFLKIRMLNVFNYPHYKILLNIKGIPLLLELDNADKTEKIFDIQKNLFLHKQIIYNNDFNVIENNSSSILIHLIEKLFSDYFYLSEERWLPMAH